MDEQSTTQKQEQDKPPSYSHPFARPWLVAVIANVKGETPLRVDGPHDAGAEYDKLETIQAIQRAIESDGHTSLFIPADANLPYALRDIRPDICFNIAEGLGGDAREAQVPALLEMLGIPYTASRVQTNAISLDKTLTKRIWRDYHLPIAPFQEFRTGHETLRAGLHFPLFVKPAREGTGMGIDSKALVHNAAELKQRVAYIVHEYHQPALVETYLSGREFTVGVLGGPEAHLYARRPNYYGPDGFHRFPIVEIESSHAVEPGLYGYKAKSMGLYDEGAPGYLCPATLDARLEASLQRLARRAHAAIGALDVSRVDMRLDAAGTPTLIEINTLPGLTPEFSDLCIMGSRGGMPYQDLILEILYLAAGRFGMLSVPVEFMARKRERFLQPLRLSKLR